MNYPQTEEQAIREKLIKSDLIECVIGLGPNLFYNAPMEACILVCRSKKKPERKGKILLINALEEITRKNAQSYLEDKHIKKITDAYKAFADDGIFSKVITIGMTAAKNYSLSIPLYFEEPKTIEEDTYSITEHVSHWDSLCNDKNDAFTKVKELLEDVNNG